MIHEIEIEGYTPKLTERLFFGTVGSYGRERLHLRLSEDWNGMAITAIFTAAGKSTVMSVSEDRIVSVPAEATETATREGELVIKGIAPDARQYTVSLPFFVVSHGLDAGTESVMPTPSEAEQILLKAQEAAQSAFAAAKSAQEAETLMETGRVIDNELPYPYFSALHTEDNGITFVCNPDGSVTVNGRATDTARFFLSQRVSMPLYLQAEEKYTLSGCPAGGGTGGYRIFVTHTEEDRSVTDGSDQGAGYVFTAKPFPYGILIWIAAGTTCENLTFRPMLAKGERKCPFKSPAENFTAVSGEMRNLVGDAAEILDVANTYYVNRNSLVYNQHNTAVDKTYLAGSGYIDCSGFILLCLMGVRYEKSPYCGYPLEVGDYPWAFDFQGEGLRTAASICEFLTRAGCRIRWEEKTVPTNADFQKAGLRPGDLLFYARKEQDGSWVQPDRYLKISHIAIVSSAVPGEKYTLLEVTTTGTVVPSFDLEVRKDDIVAICRPDYSPRAFGRYLALTL